MEARPETTRAKSLTIEVVGWEGHKPGQHVDLRLTAEDGYRAVRSYSLAVPPNGDLVAVTVERIVDGEVSPYLVDEARPGDLLAVRGPIGGYLVWDAPIGRPPLLVGGGSGVVPLGAIARRRAAVSPSVPARLLYSVGRLDDAVYGSEIERLIEVFYTFTRSAPPGRGGNTRRVDQALLEEIAWPAGEAPLAYVCGPTAL